MTIRRNKILVIFNTWVSPDSWVPYKTSDGKTSEECADAYAFARDYCADKVSGHYWKMGFDFGGIAMGPGYTSGGVNRTMRCVKSFAPGMNPEVDNPRYTGQLIVDAIANAIKDGQLDAVFTESLVPNASPTLAGEAPDGRFFAIAPYLAKDKRFDGGSRYAAGVSDWFLDATQSLPNPTSNNWITNNRDAQLPWGRIGWPGCSFADIQRVAADANWGETQNNLTKLHVVGGTNYIAGGDTNHTDRANKYFAAKVPKAKLGAFDQTATQAGRPSPPDAGFIVDWNAFQGGTLNPPLNIFGLLFSLNPQYTPDFRALASVPSWTPMRGGWAYDWCSGSSGFGYDVIRRGGVAGILCETEPYSNGLPAVDCVAYCLLLGMTMAEANFLSDEHASPNHSVYGAPDYAPYLTLITGVPEVTTPSQKSKQHDILVAFLDAWNYDTIGLVDTFNRYGKRLTAAKNDDPTNIFLPKAIDAVNGVAAALNLHGPALRAQLNNIDAMPETEPAGPPPEPPTAEIRMFIENTVGYLTSPFQINVGEKRNMILAVQQTNGDLRMTGIFRITWSVISQEGIVRLDMPTDTILAFGCSIEGMAVGSAKIQAEITLNSPLESGIPPYVFTTTADFEVI